MSCRDDVDVPSEAQARMRALTVELQAANEAARKSINWPTRKACADCGTRRGKLRRACPTCGVPVCNACYYPTVHKHREVTA